MRRLHVFLIILASLLFITLMTSCTVGPDYQQPQFFDNKEIEKALDLKPVTPQTGARFSVLDFHDDTLESLLKQAVLDSPSIRSALIKLRQGRESLKITEVQGLPTFDAVGKYNYVNDSRHMGELLNENYFQLGIDMSWELDIFGGNRRRTEAAKADVRGALENLKNVHVSMVADVASTYVNLRTAEQLLKNAHENLRIQTDIYQTISQKYKAGLTDEITLNQAKYLVETTKMTIPQLEYESHAAANALAVLVGQLPNTLNERLNAQKKNLVSKPFYYDVKKLYELPADVIRLRPDVRMAEEKLIAQNALVGAALADMYPKISLSGLLGFQSLHFNNLINHDSYTYGYVPEVGIPLLHFGALKNNVELQKSIKEEYLIAYEQTLLQAASEINNAMVAMDKELQRNKAARMAYEKMDSVSRLNWDKYKKGLIEYSDVLDSEQRRLSAQTQMVNSNSALYRNIVTFYKSIGGTFLPEFPQNN